MVTRNVPLTYEGILAYIAKGGNAAMLSSTATVVYLQKTVYWDNVNEKETFHIANAVYFGTNIGWILPKHTYYEEVFSQGLMAFEEMGLITKWYDDVIKKKRGELSADEISKAKFSGKKEESETGQHSLTMSNLSWIFYMYFYALGGCVAVFVAENVVSRTGLKSCCKGSK